MSGDDLKLSTIYAYHDTVYVLDLDSIGPDPDLVRWTPFRWGDTDYLMMAGFVLLDDAGDEGELILLDAVQPKMWKYPGATFEDDGSLIKMLARTGKIDFRDGALRRVKTTHQMPDRGVEELLPKGRSSIWWGSTGRKRRSTDCG